MAALTSAPLVVFFASSWIFVPCEATLAVTGEPGDDVTLQCEEPRGAAITLVKWSRSDLKSEEYVFFFRESHSLESYQLPSFRGRVQLRDPEMKNGDVSVVLKNVTINDSGTYECRVSAASRRRKRNIGPSSHFIQLTVEYPGDTAVQSADGGNKDGGPKVRGNGRGNVGLPVGLVLVVLVLGGVGFMFFRKRQTEKENESPAGEEDDQQLEIPMNI